MAETQKLIEKAIDMLLIDHKLLTTLGEWRKIMPILPFCDDAHFLYFPFIWHMTLFTDLNFRSIELCKLPIAMKTHIKTINMLLMKSKVLIAGLTRILRIHKLHIRLLFFLIYLYLNYCLEIWINLYYFGSISFYGLDFPCSEIFANVETE